MRKHYPPQGIRVVEDVGIVGITIITTLTTQGTYSYCPHGVRLIRKIVKKELEFELVYKEEWKRIEEGYEWIYTEEWYYEMPTTFDHIYTEQFSE